MGRTLLLVAFILGGVCPVQLPLSPVLNSTQRSSHSYLISCNTHVPEERVTQVHWKARRPDGTYSMIAVQNPHWGNSTQLPYQEVVRLNKMDDTTYSMEITVVEKVICCEVVTYPSGKVHENCLNIEEDSEVYKVDYAVLGTLLVGGFFLLGSFILLCHICWMKKKSRELKLRNQQVWPRNHTSHAPYRRPLPSINLAYEPPSDIETPPRMTPPRQTSPRNQLSPEDPPPRNKHHVDTPLRNHWLSEDTSLGANIPPPPPRSHIMNEVPPTPSQIYSNVNRLNKPYRKVHKKILPEPPTSGEHGPKAFPYERSSAPSLMTTNTSAWLSGEASYSSEEMNSLQPSILHAPRTPESPFSTVNPMYHSSIKWT